MAAEVEGMFRRNPHTSTRAVARQIRRSHFFVHKILKKYLRWRPWKRHTSHELKERDLEARRVFCDMIVDRVRF